jgi:hypothetical protein
MPQEVLIRGSSPRGKGEEALEVLEMEEKMRMAMGMATDTGWEGMEMLTTEKNMLRLGHNNAAHFLVARNTALTDEARDI